MLASREGASVDAADPAHAEEAALLARIADGDLEAVGALYDRFAARLLPIAVRVLHDVAEAEDTLHDAFVQACERAHAFDASRGTVFVWLVTMTKNLSIDRARRRARRATLAKETAVHAEAAPSPDALAAEAASGRAVRRALGTLPREQRCVLVDTYYRGLSYREIAASQHVPLGTIKSRAARAMTALRAALAREGVGEPAL